MKNASIEIQNEVGCLGILLGEPYPETASLKLSTRAKKTCWGPNLTIKCINFIIFNQKKS